MSTQTEQQLENALVAQLETLGWEKVAIANEEELLVNLKRQLEKHNKVLFSDYEFKQILNKMARGNIFEKAKILRDKVDYTKDDGTTGYIELINQVQWCKNEYQVTHQITMVGKYTNRYDVTLLVNGLPLCQIELKRRGLEMKEAFNQTNRYHKHSFAAGYGLFGYIQLFVISNGVNTKYYANNPVNKRDFKQTYFWADKANNRITQLSEFAAIFLEKCQLSKLIAKYVVLNESRQMLMALRPYQYYAVEAIVAQVLTTNKNGYIWHTTGSGKTLTSFKAAQILTQNPKVHKVVFVVDRKDLDYQTIAEFNSFQEGSVDATNNTGRLVEQFGDSTPLIVTTLQKLNTAISKERHLKTMESLKDKKMVFIFDECHRSQFGDTHKRITEYFDNVQMFGFTGTPIFADNAAKNALGKRTTKDLFGQQLHSYVITDAIRDENVLKFCVEYIRTFKRKDDIVDIEVEAIDTAEVMEAPERLEKITDYIIANHDRKTHSQEFTAMFCVSNVKSLVAYYELFRAKKEAGEHNLKVATIFSYQANEEDADADGMGTGDDMPDEGAPENKHSREKLDEYIADYNKMFSTNYSTKDSKLFYAYYKDIGKRVKNKEVDVLLVVNMFLTGFDSPPLNTIYVDKNLKYHGLLQAYSRTNRTMGQKKSQGNIVCFRNLKSATDKTIELFANKEAQEDIILAPYEDYVKKFEQAVANLLAITPDVASVDNLLTEEDEAKFIQAFREVIRIKNVLDCFTQFTFDDLPMDEQLFADFRSKYLDLYDKVRSEKEKERISILDDIDFEIELISRDKINVSYIISLLRNMKGKKPEEQARARKSIMDILDTEAQLRSKKELIERFISQHFADMPATADVGDEFESYWDQEKQKALVVLSDEEGLDPEGLEKVLGNYLFTEKPPMRDEVIEIMNSRPSLRERATVAERVIGKIRDFVETFIDGVD
ncbi:type I restriction endonuclease subunit R [Micavibrio aeruginosavorus]|uniref:Type I restriction enzyme endonuclease subunit n=1 Tax=Micavibrio aeruginosavorus (strain ARL-13) TaxID=856793 RepID=G2KRK9_MICAA|nr:type I restriction endonuclease subunit R [Micavibrio aeruginosavorus]AEP09571.1 putative type I restriction enzyme R protein [Micavibrio aeruginosavorus ARL-13]